MALPVRWTLTTILALALLVPAGAQDIAVTAEAGPPRPAPSIAMNAAVAVDPEDLALEALAQAVDETGAVPLFVLNIHSSTLDRQLETLRSARELGLPVELVELGSGDHPDLADAEWSAVGADYGRECAEWIDAIKAEFPAAQVAIAGASPGDEPRWPDWNRGAIQACPEADAIALTAYPTVEDADDGLMVSAIARWKQTVGAVSPLLPAGKAIWVTERGSRELDGDAAEGRWLHGLRLAAQTLALAAEPRVAVLATHDPPGDGTFAAVLRATTHAAEYRPLTFSVDGDGVPGAMGGRFAAAEGDRFVLVNLSQDELAADLSGITAELPTGSLLATADPMAEMAPPPAPQPVRPDGAQVLLPAHSLVVLDGSGGPPQVGELAPDFELPSSDGGTIRLSDYRGQSAVVLYFYPKDNTPGCTTQACGIRDNLPRFEDENAVVLGVSMDDLESHAEFIDDYDLNFPLLADTEGEVSEAYGVYGTHQFGDREYTGILRTTFVIDENGRITDVIKVQDVEGHASDVLELLRQF
jgi:peroxiredoxin Q/BCP